jgi:hypothetical protein
MFFLSESVAKINCRSMGFLGTENGVKNRANNTRFSNKPILHFKQGFFATQTRLVYDANKPCF